MRSYYFQQRKTKLEYETNLKPVHTERMFTLFLFNFNNILIPLEFKL